MNACCIIPVLILPGILYNISILNINRGYRCSSLSHSIRRSHQMSFPVTLRWLRQWCDISSSNLV